MIMVACPCQPKYLAIAMEKVLLSLELLLMSNLVLSLCPQFFIKFLFFHQTIVLKKLKNVLFHRKSFFRSRDIQIFVIFSFPFQTFQIQKHKWRWNNL